MIYIYNWLLALNINLSSGYSMVKNSKVTFSFWTLNIAACV